MNRQEKELMRTLNNIFELTREGIDVRENILTMYFTVDLKEVGDDGGFGGVYYEITKSYGVDINLIMNILEYNRYIVLDYIKKLKKVKLKYTVYSDNSSGISICK